MFEQQFPNAHDKNHKPESPATPRYNCLAHALHNDLLNIWPGEDTSWPQDMNRVETTANLVNFLGRLGFADCQGDVTVEPGFEKLAIYERDGVPQHVARQKSNGQWTSKLGALVDVAHADPQVLAGGNVPNGYGAVAKVMKRPSNGRPPELPLMHPPPPAIIRP
jgi:hypothetical protein